MSRGVLSGGDYVRIPFLLIANGKRITENIKKSRLSGSVTALCIHVGLCWFHKAHSPQRKTLTQNTIEPFFPPLPTSARNIS